MFLIQFRCHRANVKNWVKAKVKVWGRKIDSVAKGKKKKRARIRQAHLLVNFLFAFSLVRLTRGSWENQPLRSRKRGIACKCKREMKWEAKRFFKNVLFTIRSSGGFSRENSTALPFILSLSSVLVTQLVRSFRMATKTTKRIREIE